MNMWPNRDAVDVLLQGVRTGKDGAVNDLLQQFREPLQRVIKFRLDPALTRRVDASDIVQDVLIEATQRLADYLKNPNMPFHLWLRHLAQDRIIDTHRRHREAQRRSIDREQSLTRPAWMDDDSSAALISQLVDTERTPASQLIHQEFTRRLSDGIDTLDESDREIILLRHQECLSNQDVADLLKLSEAAASMRYLRALRRLRASILPDTQSDPTEGLT
jgi:RNA polymerase sigma-70 factor, ECF subfamily